jgi:Tol biopolymer transport system component
MNVDASCWSPDGQQIAFRGSITNHPKWIYLVAAGGGGAEELLPHHHGEEGHPSWSPDGNAIAFGDGVPEQKASGSAIHIVNVKSRQVSTVPGSQGLWNSRWSPDGRHLAALTRDSQSLMLFDFTTGKWKRLASGGIKDLAWSPDGRYIYFDTKDETPALFRLRLKDSKIEPVMNLQTRFQEAEASWKGLAPDGSPLILHFIGSSEVYALDLQLP